jgi:hypothetical protein
MPTSDAPATSDAPVSISAHLTATALTAWHFGLSAPRLPLIAFALRCV